MGSRYEEIARDLREQITSGILAPGSALPMGREIAAQYDVSDITVRKATAVLQREGLIESRRRAGLYVREHPDRVRLMIRNRQIERDELGYFSGPEVQHWRALPHPDGDRTRVTDQPVPTDIADVLEVEPGTVLTVRKRIIGDPEVPEHRQLADSWIANWVSQEVPALSGDTGAGGMYDRLEEWAQKPLHWREEVSARMPSPEEANALLMPKTGVPVIRVLRITYFAGRGKQSSRTVEVQDIRMSAALFAVGYPVPRGSSAKFPAKAATSSYYKASDPQN
ncbi:MULTISPECIES: GntR family transcriptional regulator [Streptomyces]|uniref:GntR family transcriptional regulator n=1 Tax=Streptomyces TaxID=1883 RepID=UPI0033D60D53